MDIFFEVASGPCHYEGILGLQRENLLSEVEAEDRSRSGFVFARHSLELLERMSVDMPQIVAMSEGRVVGYNLAMSAAMRDYLPSLKPMFMEFDRMTYGGRALRDIRFVVGGQVCVDKAFRGRGLIGRLYHETRNRLPADYELCITEVSERNGVSMAAHRKVGFEVVGSYNDGSEAWNVMVWDFRRLSSTSMRHVRW